MDPTAAYLQMFEAIKDGERASAREYAKALQQWLAKGGFYPPGHSVAEVDADIANVLRSTTIQNLGAQTAGNGLPQYLKLVVAARQYIRRGFRVVPVPAGQKSPMVWGWQHLQIDESQVRDAFRYAGNLGLLLGEPSGGLVDVDLDCPEARDLADEFLPPTAGITGRASSPRSHRWYICPGIQTMQCRDPVTRASIVELRSTGAQTLVGPSIHPSGEFYDPLDGDPAHVDATVLHQAVSQLAAEVIRLRHGNITPQLPRSILPAFDPPVQGDHGAILARASRYLGAMPAAISGQGGHNATYAAATALVHGFCLSPTEALELLQREFNSRCKPQWAERELMHKVKDATEQPHQRPWGWLISQV